MSRQSASFSLVTSVALALLTPVVCASGAAAIEIRQRHGAYELTVPASRIVVSIPHGDLVPGKGPVGMVTSGGYFYLVDNARHLIVSGWFVPEQEFPGLEEFWKQQTRQLRDAGIPDPQNVSFARYSDWNAVLYDIPVPFGSNSHVRAHWIRAGTWIDLHLSITSDRPTAENRAILKRTLKTLRVELKQ